MRTARLALLLAILGLAACGQTGGLYQPTPDTDDASRAAPAGA